MENYNIDKVYFKNKYFMVVKDNGFYHLFFVKLNTSLFFENQGEFWKIPKIEKMIGDKEDRTRFAFRIGWGKIAIGINNFRES